MLGLGSADDDGFVETGPVHKIKDADMGQLSSSTRMLLVQLKASLHADGLRLGFDSAQITISDLRASDDPPKVQLHTRIAEKARMRFGPVEGEF